MSRLRDEDIDALLIDSDFEFSDDSGCDFGDTDNDPDFVDNNSIHNTNDVNAACLFNLTTKSTTSITYFRSSLVESLIKKTVIPKSPSAEKHKLQKCKRSRCRTFFTCMLFEEIESSWYSVFDLVGGFLEPVKILTVES
ncbi:hypothetical protein QTP88_020676 [Uroleucon formosanum]